MQCNPSIGKAVEHQVSSPEDRAQVNTRVCTRRHTRTVLEHNCASQQNSDTAQTSINIEWISPCVFIQGKPWLQLCTDKSQRHTIEQKMQISKDYIGFPLYKVKACRTSWAANSLESFPLGEGRACMGDTQGLPGCGKVLFFGLGVKFSDDSVLQRNIFFHILLCILLYFICLKKFPNIMRPRKYHFLKIKWF